MNITEQNLSKMIGNIIKTKRKLRKMTQKELGKLIGITFQQVQKYEKGINNVSLVKLIQISKILKLDLSAIFQLDPNLPKDKMNLYNHSKDEQLLLSYFYKLTDNSYKKLGLKTLKLINDFQNGKI